MRTAPQAHICDCLAAAAGTVWEGLVGAALLEELCHWCWALRLQRTMPVQSSSLCLLTVGSVCKLPGTASAPGLPVSAVLPTVTVKDSTSETLGKSLGKCFLLQGVLAMVVFQHSNRTVTKTVSTLTTRSSRGVQMIPSALLSLWDGIHMGSLGSPKAKCPNQPLRRCNRVAASGPRQWEGGAMHLGPKDLLPM